MHAYLFQVRSAAAATAAELMPAYAAMLRDVPAIRQKPEEQQAAFFELLAALENELNTVELLLGQGGAA